MVRRIILGGAAAALAVAGLSFMPHADAAPRGAECNISGGATISPGLTTAAADQSVRLSGIQLTGCRVGSSASPGVPTTVSGSVTVSPNPSFSRASCAKGKLKDLVATIQWSTGTRTVAEFSTNNVTGAVAIIGKVLSSTDPNLQAGDLLAGSVAFTPTTTKQNCAKVPVTEVSFTGVIAAGSPK
jgi:hypothetical protein